MGHNVELSGEWMDTLRSVIARDVAGSGQQRQNRVGRGTESRDCTRLTGTRGCGEVSRPMLGAWQTETNGPRAEECEIVTEEDNESGSVAGSVGEVAVFCGRAV